MLLLLSLLTAEPAVAGGADVGGYFRVMGRPDFQGGSGRLGFWNLHGRLMNEGPYGMLELRYDVLEPQPGSTQPWTALHARIEGGSLGNASASNGTLADFRMSQVFVKTGNVALKDVTWQVGTLEYFFGDLGLYDMRPATVFFDTVGVSGRYESDTVEVLVAAGDSGFNIHGLDYNAVPTVGGTVRLRVGRHLELGTGGEALFEGKRLGNTNAPYHTPGIDYEDWVRGEITERFLAEFPGLEDSFPNPRPRSSKSWKVIGYLGFGDLGPIQWNNLFASYRKRHPDTFTTEDLAAQTVEIYVHDFTDQRLQFTLGNEMQLQILPDKFDAVWGVLYGNHRDADNDLVPSDHDRRYASTVLRLVAYATPTVHFLVESSLAREHSTNGRAYREHADSIFANINGNPNSRGLQVGDTDTRHTWQGKGGIVLSPLGTGIYTRPSLRLLYGTQYSNVNNAFGNNFVESLDQFNDFAAVEQHWHHLLAAEAEVWF